MTAHATGTGIGAEALRERALDALAAARERTLRLTSCVEDDDLTAQHSPLMSPLVWDLAHIGNQEEQWLWRTVAGRDALRPEIDSLYDAFEHPRAERPSLPLLAPGEEAITAYYMTRVMLMTFFGEKRWQPDENGNPP
ncbi:DinB family protein, partial [Streptomyces sp. NPDC096068]|uniref:DinB family protein n=1 Tax=Streptomyces sp. NPDC096068 TaxID=3155424 RepID=UPI00332A0BF1